MAKDPYRYFRVEAHELVEQLGQGVLELEKGVGGAGQVARLLRLAHTLKGAARVVRQAGIADLIHGVEDQLAPYRDAAALPRERADSLLAAFDAIAALLAQLPQPEAAAPSAAAPPVAAPEPGQRAARADTLELDALLEGLGEIGGELAALRRHVGRLDDVAELAQALRQNLAAPARAAALAEQLQALAAGLERALAGGAERIDRELRQSRDAAERLRLVPVGGVFHALERCARDAAHSQGKQVLFEASGGELRIDGAVLDAVQGALMQLVRNAVAHGIEAPARRAAAGKPGPGRITLEVRRRGYRVWFQCRDDGAGIDLDAVRRVLAERGASGAEIAGYDAAGLLARLLGGGITTSRVVTELAGRGIGLDVVRAAMQELGGEVRASSEAGRGCLVELRVPLSLAALDVLMVEADGQVLALPLDAVKGTLRVAREQIVRGADGDAIVHQGRTLPLRPLSLGLREKGAHRWSPRALTAVIVQSGAALTALAVTRLRGIDSVVLRALPALAPADATVLGLHLDGEGNPRLVLDPDALAGAPRRADGGAAAAAAPPGTILIVDDSLTTRMLESSILESAGFQVALAASAEEGLAMARRAPYALFLVDVEMPGMDGFGFLEAARADARLAHIPGILVTSCETPEHRRRGAEAGAAAYIVKGEFDQVDFLRRVGALVAR
ncbi:hybrid sensor histidine kinase/response regulator [Janthinobacterium fluminis]|uniref:histidine kinase n=1 Tax=Janthinobacterium fluminis TaxID=2987524 RepID=A0ABT5K0V0_9BURK|nr:response regulator [Janthinobacterium fluminis]MDC8758554.1 response regulator [Janthinobacterium fluminis]